VYADWATRIGEVVLARYPELADTYPAYEALLAEALAMKLRPRRVSAGELPAFQNRTRGWCDAVLRTLLKHELDLSFGSYAELPDLWVSHPVVRARYWRPPGRWVCQRINARRMARLWRERGVASPPEPRRFWSHELYALIPLVFFSDVDGAARSVLPDRLREIFGIATAGPRNTAAAVTSLHCLLVL
jgi:hypothetical protein